MTTDYLHLTADTYLGRWELYDYRNDPHEERNLFDVLQRPSRRLRLAIDDYERRLNEVERRSAALASAGPAPALSERSAAQMRALGYLD